MRKLIRRDMLIVIDGENTEAAALLKERHLTLSRTWLGRRKNEH